MQLFRQPAEQKSLARKEEGNKGGVKLIAVECFFVERFS